MQRHRECPLLADLRRVSHLQGFRVISPRAKPLREFHAAVRQDRRADGLKRGDDNGNQTDSNQGGCEGRLDAGQGFGIEVVGSNLTYVRERFQT